MDQQSIGGYREAASKKNKKKGLDIQFGMRLHCCPRLDGFLNDKTYRRVITRNGPFPQVLEDMRVAMKISHLSYK